jgi:16S rRNA (uracil1498-N3)-methyltransferase
LYILAQTKVLCKDFNTVFSSFWYILNDNCCFNLSFLLKFYKGVNMFNFFVESSSILGDTVTITGDNFNHLKKVLRMKVGDEFLISHNGKSSLCELFEFTQSTAIAKIIEEDYQNTELPVKFYLFQGLPKSDKFELIIQKAVELGVYEIIPVEMDRCVVKLDGKKKDSKVERWQAIAESAAKQSKRTLIPKVNSVLNFRQAIEKAKTLDLFAAPYENALGMTATKDFLSKIKSGNSVGVIIGPEGGFADNEIAQVLDAGGASVSLGARILRTETAAITTLSLLMLHTEMNI